ncbi:hypothetical protein JMJ77_0003789 [Colletotrichum scovillei]|uniref:Uncharacterized protein n=1 Tax=Colletotrichum scovillei TaxID=1209932 RepID=A0A9P7QYH7_9PEZI|nr:hypothetical protein JMJ77_0003789 [Colletotrichum scovillei]KAG7049035.1 hypothetical protein JMJ78_0013019 [Colletotrichum scovillei]KAG7063779.1 hypothetical protein JMJ76_0006828 [Colletotrichum scovillei]
MFRYADPSLSHKEILALKKPPSTSARLPFKLPLYEGLLYGLLNFAEVVLCRVAVDEILEVLCFYRRVVVPLEATVVSFELAP